MPFVRARVRRRPRAGAARLGRRAARRWPRPLTWRSPIRRRPWSRRTRSPSRTSRRRRAARPAARARRLLLLACRHDRGALCPPRPPRARLARRARRSQHARDVAVRERVGHAAADDRRRGDVEARKRRADRRAEPRSARRDVHRRERDPNGAGCGRPRARRLLRRVRRLRRGFARSRRDRPFMPEPDGVLDEVERLFLDLAAAPRWSASASAASLPTRTTLGGWSACPALGL